MIAATVERGGSRHGVFATDRRCCWRTEADGLLTLRVENTLALQQPAKPDGSNSTETLNGGWPAYEFSDGSAAFSGILRKPGGDPAIRLYAQSGADTPNRLTVEFQDEFNEYQQDSLSLVDVDDALLDAAGSHGVVCGAGAAEFRSGDADAGPAARKSTVGSTLVEFETTVRGVGLTPGDLITVTYLKEGLAAAAVSRDATGAGTELSDGAGHGAVARRRLVHDGRRERGGWTSAVALRKAGCRGRWWEAWWIANGIEQFGITETVIPLSDGGFPVKLSAGVHAARSNGAVAARTFRW